MYSSRATFNRFAVIGEYTFNVLVKESPTPIDWQQDVFELPRHDPISHCRMTLDLNPYHFGAAGGMGQCHVQLGNLQEALKSFRQALGINPGLEGIRASVTCLERSLSQRSCSLLIGITPVESLGSP